ncbi:hypothetical protein SK128_017991 [Halocaridina rubra]|uniref:Uncharacterized protein n=1 Tax=Halocaridina rubra TaxID=373956 RepID=A0AAN8WMC5_HALRR
MEINNKIKQSVETEHRTGKKSVGEVEELERRQRGLREVSDTVRDRSRDEFENGLPGGEREGTITIMMDG